ncbi:hypothetical protein FHX82_005060 [Amycolatopsis bartoniae]|nr:hypothetical protein [Amycolatopsis bartoniae]
MSEINELQNLVEDDETTKPSVTSPELASKSTSSVVC